MIIQIQKYPAMFQQIRHLFKSDNQVNKTPVMDTLTEEETGETWLTTADVIARLKISESTVHRMRRGGQLVPYYLNRSMRFRESDVLRAQKQLKNLVPGTGNVRKENSGSPTNGSFADSPELQLASLRSLYTAWMFIFFFILCGNMYYLFTLISPGIAQINIPLLIKVLLASLLDIFLFSYLVRGTFNQKNRNPAYLIIFGRVAQPAILLALMLIGMSLYTSAFELTRADRRNIFLIGLGLSGLGVYTVAVGKVGKN